MAARAGRSLTGSTPLRSPVDFGIGHKNPKGRKAGKRKGPAGRHAGQRRG